MNKRSYLVALLLCLCGQLGANDLVLRPAAAEYAISVSGVPTGMSANIDLQHLARDRFHLTFSVDNKLIRHQEQSRFYWRNCHAQPLGYAYQSSGFGIRRGGQVDFDWPGLLARGTTGEYRIDNEVVDALGLAMMARCQLKVGLTSLAFKVAEPEGVTGFNYEVVGREQLKTPAGTFNTIKIERIYPEKGRRTFLWAAEDMDYFMVRMDHIENPLVRGKMELKSLRWLDTDDSQVADMPSAATSH